jgi:hypothetical protein
VAAASGSSLLVALCALACAHDPEPSGAAEPAGAGRSGAAASSGVAGGLRALATDRGVALSVRDCAPVGGSRVVICRAELSATELAALRTALQMGPLGQTRAPGPAFGKSRCLDRAPTGAIALVTGFPWLPRSHYRYLLVVVPEAGGTACVETEEGYG